MTGDSAAGCTRLLLSRPSTADIPDLFEVESDPRTWTHYPSLRLTTPAPFERFVRAASASWDEVGLGPWTVRLRDSGRIIGSGGCRWVRPGWFNLGFRLDADLHGRGLGAELARAALTELVAWRQSPPQRRGSGVPDAPVVAYLLEHNLASRATVERAGLRLAWRGPEPGFPGGEATRLVYSDRALSEGVLEAVCG
ncbi:GNAT family N-acetyltransferase [Micrococcales bacterium 31B]|nr:GNAT family N-acetyltransferase [Micrococcales bacterium 31B]